MFCFCNSIEEEHDGRFNALESPQEKIIKLAVLGPSDCGKTTIIKQLTKIHHTFDEEDSKNMVNYIRDAVVSNMKMLCDQSLILSENYNLPTAVNRSVEYLRDELLSLRDSTNLFNNDIAFKIKELWNDSGIRRTLQQRHYFQIGDNVEHFFNKIDEIATNDYAPDFDDYIRIRRRSIGYSPTKFTKFVDTFGEYRFEIPDVGGTRSERRKWWNPKLLLDPQLKAIIYVVPLSDYDLTLYEDNETNRLMESIDLFQKIMIKGNFFADKSILLFFNKYDLFTKKIEQVPITVCFDDFDEDEMNPHDANDVMQFVAGKFLNIFHEHNINLSKPLRILRTTAIDTDNIRDAFDKIVPGIVQPTVASFAIDAIDAI